MRHRVSIPIVAALVYVAVATTAFQLIPWTGPAPFLMLLAVHVALGVAVGRWWALLLPPPLLAILLATADCTGELCGGGFYAFFLAWYAGVACALVALGVVSRRLIERQGAPRGRPL
jgi:hypothetical protein